MKNVCSLRAQSAMEYLMTYGWAILIIAVALAALFELGVFNGGQTLTQACIAQPGFVCTSMVYNSASISFNFGQTTGQNYYGNYLFLAGEGQGLSPNGVPVNFTSIAPISLGMQGPVPPANVLTSGQTVSAVFPANDYKLGNVPPYTGVQPATGLATGTPFAGYVWLGYCFTSTCPFPGLYFAKVATVIAKSAD